MNGIIECIDCGLESDTVISKDSSLSNVSCPRCQSGRIVFRTFYLHKDDHIKRKNQRIFREDLRPWCKI